MPGSITVQVVNGMSNVLQMGDTMKFTAAPGQEHVKIMVTWFDFTSKHMVKVVVPVGQYTAAELLHYAEIALTDKNMNELVYGGSKKKVIPDYGGSMFTGTAADNGAPLQAMPTPVPAPAPKWYTVSIKDNNGVVAHAFTIAVPAGAPMPNFYAQISQIF